MSRIVGLLSLSRHFWPSRSFSPSSIQTALRDSGLQRQSLLLAGIRMQTLHNPEIAVRGVKQLRGEPTAGSIAIVRGVPDSFIHSLSMEKPKVPIDVHKARDQHAVYVNTLRGLVQEVVEIPADEHYPDCPFVEDTAVVISTRALITRPGAPSRQGEEEATKKVLLDLGLQVTTAEPPARIDGGDVLYASGRLFVGLSSRTDEAGVAALRSAFPDTEVVAIPMGRGGLHLKSVLSCISESMLAVEDNEEALQLFQAVCQNGASFEPLQVPDVGAANTLLVNDALLFPSAYSNNSSALYSQFTERAIPINLSEFHKADGGMTCLSIIVGH